MIHPLILGDGRHLFRGGILKTPLTLVDSTPSTTGVIIARFVPAAR